MRKAFVVVVLLAATLSLSACESTVPIPTPSPSQIVGTWRHGSDTVTINADGTFGIAGMPLGVIEQAPVASGAVPAGPAEAISGTWAIGSGGTDVGGAPGVQLDFVHPQKVGFNYGLTLIVAGGSPVQLYVTLGRPDSNIRYTFTKRASS
jgi:hypothetical protein